MKLTVEQTKTPSAFYPLAYLPALAAAFYILFSNLRYWNALPASMAVHFDGQGRPNGYMSREVSLSVMLGLILLLSLINLLVGTAWTSRRIRGKFNVFVVVYAEVCALMAWVNHGLIEFNLGASQTFSMMPGFALAVLSGALGYSVLVELRRSKAAATEGPTESPTAGKRPESVLRLRSGARFYVEQRSNPWWWNPLILVSCLVPLLSIGLSVGFYPQAGAESVLKLLSWLVLPLLFVILIPVLLVFFGGYRYSAGSDGLAVKLGLFGVPLKRIPLESIRNVTVIRDFSPLAVFCGYGWRINYSQRLTGYCLCGGDAIKVETADWNYILVMDDADNFGQVIRQAAHCSECADLS